MPELTKHIIAYVMHETERASALQVVSKPQRSTAESTISTVLGEATMAEISQLREQGILVRELDQATPSAFTSHAQLESLMQPFSMAESSEPHRFLLRLQGPMLEERRQRLVERGVLLQEALPQDYYKIELRPDQVDDVTFLPFVLELVPERVADQPGLESLGLYCEDGAGAVPSRARVATPEFIDNKVPHDLWLREGTEVQAFTVQLAEAGHIIVGSGGQKVRFLAVPGSPELRAVKMMPMVEIVEEFVPPELHNANARGLLGLAVPAAGGQPMPWTGSKEIVGIADTGLDASHPDFQQAGKLVVPPRDLGRPGQTDDPHGHGTHVAGSVLGDGTASGGLLRGTAPDARLFFQSVLGHPQPKNQFPLTGLPVALATLFDEAYKAGARIHNNSWGSFAAAYYRLSSREVDQYVHGVRRDMLIVISAGNDGTTQDPAPPGQRRSGKGFVDWNSLGAPATSKNALVVGASQSDITNAGFATFTHAQIWPAKFRSAGVANDIADLNISGAAEELAGFSSRGPTDRLQVKPDVVAPGTDIASARSSLAPAQHYSGPHSSFPGKYAHMCGTSMAAPLVSGCAAVVRQYLSEVKGYQTPSAALMKAILINGTRQLTGVHSNASARGFPNGHQGFGCIDMSTTLPNPSSAASFDLCYYDNWQDQPTHLGDNDRQRFAFTLGNNAPWLRICMAYTDRPGVGVQNVLFLQLHHVSGPPTAKWYGNKEQQADLASVLYTPDRHNNVAIIRIPNPPPGDYVIQVSPENLPFGGAQDFALAVSAAGLAASFRAL